jgi:hypothetical protein
MINGLGREDARSVDTQYGKSLFDLPNSRVEFSFGEKNYTPLLCSSKNLTSAVCVHN